MITKFLSDWLVAHNIYLPLMEKVTFMFLNEYSLQQFISRTNGVLLKPDVENLTVVCNCNGNECRRGIIEQAQTDYGAMVIRGI